MESLPWWNKVIRSSVIPRSELWDRGLRRSRRCGASRGFVREGDGPGTVGYHLHFRGFFRGRSSSLQHAVQGLDVAGAFDRQLVGHRVHRAAGEGAGPLTHVLSLALQVLVQHVAAERRQVLLRSFRRGGTKER